MNFIKAKPIWLEGLENENNVMAGFRTKTDKEGEAELFIASPCLFRVFYDGRLFAANTEIADEKHIFSVKLTLCGGENVIAIEAVSSEFKPNYICAEIALDGEIICASGYDFNGLRLYAQDRGIDFWKLDREEKHWQNDETMFDSTQLTDTEMNFYEDYINLKPLSRISEGIFKESGMLESALADEITDYDASKYIRDFLLTHKIKIEDLNSAGEITVREGSYVLVEFSELLSGHIFLKVVANKDSRFNIAAGENAENALNPQNEESVTAFELHESINTFELTSFNAYNIKYAAVAVTRGEIIIKEISVIS